MRKLIFIVAAVIIGTTACNSSDGKNPKETNSLNTEKTTKNSPVSLTTGDGAPIHLTKQKFLDEIMDYEKNPQEWIYKGKMPGLIDFYADWCRPCKITSPILNELAEEYKGKIKIYKVNIEEERELASIFGVQSIPTFLWMPMEGKPSVTNGISQTPQETKEMFRQIIDEVLLNKKEL